MADALLRWLSFTGMASGAVVSSNVNTTQVGDFVASVLFAGAVHFTGISSGNEFTDDFNSNGSGWAHITGTSATAGTHQAIWYTANAFAGKCCASTVAFFAAN